MRSWNNSVHFCQWHGVKCGRRRQRVTELDLQALKLMGSISPYIGNLSFLRVLELQNNSFVSDNEMSGIVPSSLANLSNIRILDIGVNNFYGSLPSKLGVNMPYLEHFFVGLNQLSGPFPLSIANASNLIKLQLEGNKFTGNMSSFGKLEKLLRFNIANNLLGSQGANDLNFLCSLTNATSLEFVDLGYNRFGGVLPECISNLPTTITFFGMQHNNIVGRISTGFGNLMNLEGLEAGENQLSGSIPSVIGRLEKLQLFDVRANYLSGAIPTSLGNLTILIQLFLNDNNLQGDIPPSLGKCENLVLLALSNNNLSGSIPFEIARLSSLSIGLYLYSNHLTGMLPFEVGNLRNLGILDVSQNMLSGVIPDSLGNCLVLEQLLMSGNFFHGSIPSALSSLRGLTNLDISSNNLTGKIPEFLVTFGALHILNISYNDFEGLVPLDGVFKNVSATFLEGNSKLCGGLPEFHLPTCDNLKLHRRRSTIAIKSIIAIVSALTGVILVFSSIFLFCYRKKRKHPASPNAEDSLLKLSYQSILKATNGFSSENLVGAGSFGLVYKGILEENGTIIAVKVLKLLSRRASRSFSAECEALRNVRHRNLVKVLTACSGVDYRGDDFKALVYEFMANGSLEDWLHPPVGINKAEEAPKSLNFFQRLNVAIDVGSALEYLHHHLETPIVHCDLKPSNVLLDAEMVGHVGDFGLAKFIASDLQNNTSSLSSSLGLRGTIGYAPPEYGLGSNVTTYGDVYSYGILLLEMFTGKRPTDEMFKENLNLHKFVKTALPNRVAEITDPILLQESFTFNDEPKRK
ncbi:hypothetical protein REPUB_Repub13aG0097700 [Reevesia pubescens]